MQEERAKRAARHAQQDREAEASQRALRKSIAETDRLVLEPDAMLKRHRQERDREEDRVSRPDVAAKVAVNEGRS